MFSEITSSVFLHSLTMYGTRSTRLLGGSLRSWLILVRFLHIVSLVSALSVGLLSNNVWKKLFGREAPLAGAAWVWLSKCVSET